MTSGISTSKGEKGLGAGKAVRRSLSVLRFMAKLALPLVVIGLAAFVANFLVDSKPPVKQRMAREKAYAVQTQTITPAVHQPNIVLYGTVIASRKVDLRALVGGEVIWVNPDLVEGQLLDEHAELVRIDPFDYEGGVREAKANLTEAQAKLTETNASIRSEESALGRLKEQREFAQKDLERAEKLVASGSLTRQALENRKLTLSQREQAVEARQNNLTVLKARIEQQEANLERLTWRLDQSRRNLADTSLKAPFTGLVQTKSVELGRSVSGNDSLVSMYDPNAMDVRFTLSDSQYGRLIEGGNDLQGRQIVVNWRLGDSIQSHEATIQRITPEVNAAKGGIEVFARLEVKSGLRAGTFVELLVPDRSYQQAIQIPQAAIYSNNIVYLNVDGRMEPAKISVLAYLGENALIDASGLPKGEQVITTRIAEAGKGLKVLVPDLKTKGDGQEADQPGNLASGSDSKARSAKPRF